MLKTDTEHPARPFVLPIALAVQHGNIRSVEAGRTFENLIHYQQRINRKGPAGWNRMEIGEHRGKKYAFRVKNCLFYAFFSSIGAPELAEFMCATDNAVFSSCLPEEVTFHGNRLYNTITDGASECRFIFEYKAPWASFKSTGNP